MIEAGAAVEKSCATVERKYEIVIKMIDRYIKSAIEKGQFSIHISQEMIEQEVGLYLDNEIRFILRVYKEHGYEIREMASGDIYILW